MTAMRHPRQILTAGRTRMRITGIAVLAAAAVAIPAGVLGYSAVATAQEAAVEVTAVAQAQSIVGLLNEAVLPENYQANLPYQVSTEDGRVLAASSDLSRFQEQGAIATDSWAPLVAEDGSFSYRETAFVLSSGGTTPGALEGPILHTIDTYTSIGASQSALVDLASGTTVRVLVIMTPSDTNNLLNDTRAVIFFAVPSAVVVLAVAVWFSVGFALRPITVMSRRVNAISSARAGDRIVVPPTFDEVQELATTLNSLLDRLDQSDSRERAFLDDAAHELRSPVASLLTTLEVAERYPNAIDWRETLAAAIRQARRLQLLSDDLLLLTNLESESPAELLPVDLSSLVARLADSVVHSHRLVLDIDQGIIVSGQERDLERLVRNLLDNAERHARSIIHLSLNHVGEGSIARLSIRNDGDPVSADSVERIFDRLVRLDAARDTTAGGAGLGLAIARQIAHNHHARLTCVPLARGAEFRLDIPAGTRSVPD